MTKCSQTLTVTFLKKFKKNIYFLYFQIISKINMKKHKKKNKEKQTRRKTQIPRWRSFYFLRKPWWQYYFYFLFYFGLMSDSFVECVQGDGIGNCAVPFVFFNYLTFLGFIWSWGWRWLLYMEVLLESIFIRFRVY
jgi:hypothetical protein